MTKSYVIEVGDDQVGVVIREAGERDFQFHAALPAYQALEGRRFSDPYYAERAARAHAARKQSRQRPTEAYAGEDTPANGGIQNVRKGIHATIAATR